MQQKCRRAAAGVCAAALLCAVPPAAQAATLVFADCFEAPLQDGQQYQAFYPLSKINGLWTVTGSAQGFVSVNRRTDPALSFTVPKVCGDQVLFLGDGPDHNGVRARTAVALGAGKTYALTFYVGYVRGGPDGDPNATTGVYIDGHLINTVTASTGSTTRLAWQHHSLSFKASATKKITIEFRNAGSKRGSVNALARAALNLVKATNTAEPAAAVSVAPLDPDRSNLAPSD